MDGEDENQTTESSTSSSSEAQESRPEFKLRDLRPEKDPMGSGTKVVAGKSAE